VPELRILEKTANRLKSDNYDLLIQIGICFVLFLTSIFIRLALRSWFLSNFHTISYFSIEGYEWEIYDDPEVYYQHYLYAFKYESWNPYAYDRGYPLSGYVYGPYFVYFLVFISFFIDLFFPGLPRMDRAWMSVTFAPIVFDSLTTVFIYLILLKKQPDGKRSKLNQFYALLGAVVFIFMPLVLFYNDFIYLNSYMFTTFTIISFYCLQKSKHKLSAFFLAMSLLTKLNSLFLAPLWFLYLFRIDRKIASRYLIHLIFFFFLLSVPWIFINPLYYIALQAWPAGTANTAFSISDIYIWWTTTPFHAFLYWGMEGLAKFYYYLNLAYVPLFLFLIICYFTILLKAPHFKENESSFYVFQAMFVIGYHVFLSRGNYKYYDSFFIPFIILAFASRAQDFKRKWLGLSLFLVFSGWIAWLSIWLMVKVKWLHIFYTFLMMITMIVTFDVPLHTTFYKKKNYSDLFDYLKTQKKEITKAIEQRKKKRKEKKEAKHKKLL
jgi:hypothetical protein